MHRPNERRKKRRRRQEGTLGNRPTESKDTQKTDVAPRSEQNQKRQAANSMNKTPDRREGQVGARDPRPQGRRQHPTPHAPPRTRHAQACTRTQPCSGHGCEIAWIKGSVDAAEADQSSGRKGGVLPCPGLPPLAGREGAWSFVLADQGGTRNSVSRSSINLVPSLVYR